jgi:hypothetical protein
MASPGRWRAAPRACPLLALAALGSLCAGARGCTVLRLQGSGFASNAIHVLHAVPVYDGTNGTLFLDSSRFRYACEEGGGWHDFFATQARAPTACRVCFCSLRCTIFDRKYRASPCSSANACADAHTAFGSCAAAGGQHLAWTDLAWTEAGGSAQDLLVPWSPAKEEAAGEACEHVTFSDVDYVLHTRLKVGWDSFNAEGAARVRRAPCS